MHWYAVYTKPKCEDSAARILNNAGIETLNPKISVIKTARGRFTKTIEQLFPSYIFADRRPYSSWLSAISISKGRMWKE